MIFDIQYSHGSIWGHFNAFFMNDIEEKLMNNLNDLLDDNIEAINVRNFGTRDRKSVQIMIESEDGITVESCANELLRTAQNIIKLENIIDR